MTRSSGYDLIIGKRDSNVQLIYFKNVDFPWRDLQGCQWDSGLGEEKAGVSWVIFDSFLKRATADIKKEKVPPPHFDFLF